ncbi:beta-amyrin 28-monooxygenase-like [Prosopis cineraria]|uniref:beta-amyrin 28-monooxygenase-like n=1 Tax=Prosopis cineraria TaxID=364024 RepID=UPI00240FAA54|nr:beta-amyrin 28-monooxygenase-like [Prosopis cineraria]XP_054796010.1 beta-amyrin 28-monooxygenase-like [Prosopis cineraria]
MEPLLLSICVIVFTLVSLFVYNAKSHGKSKNLPPGSFGWPFIGETYEFIFSNHDKFISDRMQNYSSKIFKTHLYGQPTVVLCGPSGHKFIAANEGKLMTAWRPTATRKLFQSAMPTGDSIVSRQSEIHLVRAPVFITQEALVAYASVMDGMTKHHFETHWFGKSQVEVFSLLELLTVGIATRLFMGLQDLDCVAKMAKWFGHIAQGLHVLPYEIPGTTFGRAMKGKRAVMNEIMKLINEKRERLAKGEMPTDILSYMMVSADPSGKIR